MLFLLWIWCSLGQPVTADHPIHVSVSEAVLTPHHIDWTIRIYTDDLLLGLYGKPADLTQIPELETIKSDILTYLNKNLQVTLNSRPVTWKLLDVNRDPEAVWVTLQGRHNETNFHEMVVANHTLTEVYADQKNIMHIQQEDRKQHVIAEKGDGFKTLKW